MSYTATTAKEFRQQKGSLAKKITDEFAAIEAGAGAGVRTATVVVAAADSLHPEQADWQCTGEGDQVTIQAAINALPSGGGIVLLMAGNYYFTDDIVIAGANVCIEGMGWNTIFHVKNQPIATLTSDAGIGDTVLYVDDVDGFVVGERIEVGVSGGELKHVHAIGANTITVTEPMVNAYLTTDKVYSVFSCVYVRYGVNTTLKNFKINGNVANWPILSGTCGTQYEIRYEDADFLRIEGVEVTNSRHRPLRGVGDHVRISNCYLHDMSHGGGVHTEGTAGRIWYDTVISNCVFDMPSTGGSEQPAFKTTWGEGLVVRDSYISGYANICMMKHANFENVTFMPNGFDYPIYVESGYDIGFSKCTFDDVTVRVLKFGDNPVSEMVNFHNNHFLNNARLLVYSGSNHVDITRNTFHELTNVPVQLVGTSVLSLIGIQFNKNKFIDCSGTYTTKIEYIDGLDFCGNNFYNSTRNTFQHCNNIIASNNIFDSMTSYALSFEDDTQNITAIGNTFKNCSSRGICLMTNSAHPATPVCIMGNRIDAVPNIYNSTYTNVRYVANDGFVTEASGTATIPAAASFIDVIHGLAVTPTAKDISVTPAGSLRNASEYWIDTIGVSTFRINVDVNPGTGTVLFAWNAIVL